MNEAGRNPYVMLGVPFGASRSTATKAFARKAKGLRTVAGGAARLTELTWALNQIEEALKDPRTALHIYRVPADEGALIPAALGVLRPGPEPMERTTPPSQGAWQRLIQETRAEAVAALQRELASVVRLPDR